MQTVKCSAWQRSTFGNVVFLFCNRCSSNHFKGRFWYVVYLCMIVCRRGASKKYYYKYLIHRREMVLSSLFLPLILYGSMLVRYVRGLVDNVILVTLAAQCLALLMDKCRGYNIAIIAWRHSNRGRKTDGERYTEVGWLGIVRGKGVCSCGIVILGSGMASLVSSSLLPSSSGF